MKIHSVHSRRLPADPDQVDRLVTALGGDHDRLWPIERWQTNVLAFDGPLTQVGVRGGHGGLDYTVERYEPGRELTFRFDPASGLDGTHGFEIEPDGQGSVLRHVLDARVAPRLMPMAWPLRSFHDTLIEDVLDNAERATAGHAPRSAGGKRWVRAANGVDVWVARTLGARGPLDGPARLARAAVPPALLAIAALHAAWALGSSWPSQDEQALARAVLSGGATGMPPGWASWAVTAALTATAGLVYGAGGAHPARWLRRATLAAAGVLLFRGLVYIPVDLANGLASRYDRLDLALYSPLCLALGAGVWAVARRHGRVRRVAVTDPAAAGRHHDYADSFELRLRRPDGHSPEEWVRAGVEATPTWIKRIAGNPEGLGTARIVESSADVVVLEDSDPLMDTVMIGRNVEPDRRVLTTVLRYRRPRLARAVWSLVGILHRRTARRVVMSNTYG